VLAKEGVRVPMTDLFGHAGQQMLNSLELGEAYAKRVTSLRELIAVYDREAQCFEADITRQLARHDGYQAIQTIPGVAPVLAAIFVAEIGDVHRFASARHLTSWAGLTPRHRESDTTVRRGSITKQGSRLVRWAAIEAISRNKGGTFLQQSYRRLAEQRGHRRIARVAVARKLLTLVYYGLRDGHIHCLTQPHAA
jgi:transposase